MQIRRTFRVAIPVLASVAVFAACYSAAAVAAPEHNSSLAGTWTGRYTGAFSGRFKLHWRQSRSRLVGSITLSKPSGTYSISGSVRGSAIKFGAVGVGATYTGSVSGSSMSGSYKSPQGGGRWSAHKTS
jgi:hypothetical protein